MGVGQVGDVYVVAHAGAVARGVVPTEDGDALPPAEGHLQHYGEMCIRDRRLGPEGHLEEALHGVRVHERAGVILLHGLRDGGDVRHGAGLVVHQHERDEYGVLPQGGFHLPRGYGPGAARREAGDLIAAALQLLSLIHI